MPLHPPPDHVPWGDLEATSSEGNCPLTHLDWPLESPTDQTERGSTPNARWPLCKDPASDPGHTIGPVHNGAPTPENRMSLYPTRARSIRKESQRRTLGLNTQEIQRPCHLSFHPIALRKRPNLAIRRGHKVFPYLKLQRVTAKTDATLLDTIPTAFRGSPLTSSLVSDQTQYPPPQNISLAEMLGNLRAKCASFSSRVFLPPDWPHRSRLLRNEITKLSETVSVSHSSDDEWAFAEPLMDMINSFSGGGNDLSAHPTLIKDGMSDIPIDSRSSCDVSSSYTLPLVNNDAQDRLESPEFQVGSLILRPSVIIPSSVCKHSSRSKIKKTVRFADPIILPESPVSLKPEKAEEKKNLGTTIGTPRHRRSQSISLSALIPPNPPLSVVRSLQSFTPPRSSQVNRFRNTYSKSPPRPLSYRFPRSPKLPLSMDQNLIPQSLNIPPLRTNAHKRKMANAGEILSPRLVSRPPHTSGYLRFKFKAKKARIPRANVNISGPLPMGAAIPPHKKIDSGVRGSNGKDDVTTPLRSIFMKLK